MLRRAISSLRYPLSSSKVFSNNRNNIDVILKKLRTTTSSGLGVTLVKPKPLHSGITHVNVSPNPTYLFHLLTSSKWNLFWFVHSLVLIVSAPLRLRSSIRTNCPVHIQQPNFIVTIERRDSYDPRKKKS